MISHRSLLDFLIYEEMFFSFLSVHSLDRIGTARPLQRPSPATAASPQPSRAKGRAGLNLYPLQYIIYSLNVSLLFSHITIQKAGKLANKNTNNKYIVRPKYV
jgi:hypothetical protein